MGIGQRRSSDDTRRRGWWGFDSMWEAREIREGKDSARATWQMVVPVSKLGIKRKRESRVGGKGMSLSGALEVDFLGRDPRGDLHSLKRYIPLSLRIKILAKDINF